MMDGRTKAAIISGVAVIAAAIIGVTGPWTHSSGGTAGAGQGPTTQAPTTGAPTTQDAQPIRFDPVTKPVPRCASFTGEGDVPQDRQLWVVVKTKEGGRTKYYFDEATAAGGRWSAPKVSIGSAADPTGELFNVEAVIFTNAASQDISSGRYQNGTFDLPADASVKDQMGVQLGDDHAAC